VTCNPLINASANTSSAIGDLGELALEEVDIRLEAVPWAHFDGGGGGYSWLLSE